MALLSAEHLAGPGYIILNVLRGLNIIALASVVASSVVMLVKTFIISKVRSRAGSRDSQKLTYSSFSSSTLQAMLLLRLLEYSSSSQNAHCSAISTPATGRCSVHLMALSLWVVR